MRLFQIAKISWFCFLTFCCLSLVLTPAKVLGNERLAIDVGDSSTRVMACKVNLKVSEFVLKDKKAVGLYQIKVPAAPWKNEKGRLVFTFEGPLETLVKEGGILEGVCIRNEKEGACHTVVCYIEPSKESSESGAIQLKVRTSKRLMIFDTTYSFPKEDEA